MTQMTIQQAIDLAKAHHQAGRLAEAEALYRQVLAAQPNNPEALHLLGALAMHVGKLDAALELIGRAVAINPSSPAYLFNLGRVLGGLGRAAAAAEAFQKALSLRSNFPEAWFQLGNALSDLGRWDEAIAAYQQSLSQNPGSAEAYNNLGNALRGKGEFEQAVAALRQAVSLLPENPDVHVNLGSALQDAGKLDDAIAEFRHAIDLRADSPDAFYNLGNALQAKDQLEQAIAAFRQAIALRPAFAKAQNNLGLALQLTGRFDEAIACYRQAIAIDPDYALAHHHLGLILLLQGDFEPGWREHEWRWKTRDFLPRRRDFTQPMWDGADLPGRRILVHAEQGFGDAIQFARYLPLLADSGARVIFQCHPELVDLFKGLAGIAQLLSDREAVPEFDLHCPLLSLPMLFRTTLLNIPAPGAYLHADPSLADNWRQRLSALPEPLKVGLAWAGRAEHANDRSRSMSFDRLAPLAQVPGVSWVNLQKGKASDQARSLPNGITLIDWTDELRDFSQTAALIQNLDLVIAVDTAIAHLAGAMGKAAWVLLSFVPDWRWMLDRDDSPWYPTMKLFRQARIGDWDTPIQCVIHELLLHPLVCQ